MGKRYSKRTTRKVRYAISPKEADKIIEQEFTDSKGNKMKMQIDITPQKINAPTIEWNREYNKE